MVFECGTRPSIRRELGHLHNPYECQVVSRSWRCGRGREAVDVSGRHIGRAASILSIFQPASASRAMVFVPCLVGPDEMATLDMKLDFIKGTVEA